MQSTPAKERSFYWLILENTLFAAASALSGTFVNVYLWKASQDYAVLGWFSLLQFLTMAITFCLAGIWVKEGNKMNCLRAGVAASAVFYLCVLMLGTSSVTYVWLLGILQGAASGLFWLAYNVLYFEVTSPDDRDVFNGWVGALTSLSGMIAPWISGFIIVHMPDEKGYSVIFSISMGIFILGVIVSFFITKREPVGEYMWSHSWGHFKKKNTPWRRICAALAAQGFREGVFGFMIGLLVYIATSSEQKLGNYALLTSAVSFVSYWIVGRYVKVRWRSTCMWIGAVCMVALIIPFFWRIDYVTLLIFGVGVALSIPLYTLPITSAVFDLIGSNEEHVRLREEFIILRELALNAGRLLGVIVFILVLSWRTDPLVISSMMLVIGSAPIACTLLLRRQLTSFASASTVKTIPPKYK
ncbi:MFS transporter [Paenibacillus sp. N1-5-1-14]|uniref:MFS transporter n=1 Tax=Paenibacillus radicibacter TaxID=2972488 RepID=UPI0021595767|nr:MFS transporter [Paenibacillus radicibacter]MCR8643202.1 MFS transporter [Paenibacillus radicibacter]